MKKIVFSLAILLFGCSAVAQNTANLLNSYLLVKNALVNNDGKVASELAGIFYRSVKNETDFSQKEALLQATEKLNVAGTIEEQRAAFSQVSPLLWKVLENDKKLNQTVYYQYCPMKKSYWLSKEKEIKNPYYGTSMISCGKVSATRQ